MQAALQEFAEEYTKITEWPINYAAINFYEYVYVAKALIEQAKKKGGYFYTGERLLQALHELDGRVTTPLSGELQFNLEDCTIRRPMIVTTVDRDPADPEKFILDKELAYYSLKDVLALPQ